MVKTGVMRVNGLGLTFHVSVKLCTNKFIYIVLCSPIKKCECIYTATR